MEMRHSSTAVLPTLSADALHINVLGRKTRVLTTNARLCPNTQYSIGGTTQELVMVWGHALLIETRTRGTHTHTHTTTHTHCTHTRFANLGMWRGVACSCMRLLCSCVCLLCNETERQHRNPNGPRPRHEPPHCVGKISLHAVLFRHGSHAHALLGIRAV